MTNEIKYECVPEIKECMKKDDSFAFIKNVSQIFGTRLLTLLLGITVGIITARMLGPEGKGFYTLIVLVLSYILLIGSLGVTNAIPFFIGKKRSDIGSVLATSLTFSVLCGFILAFCFILLSPFLNILFNINLNTEVMLIVIIAIPFVLLDNFVVSILLGLRKYNYYNLLLLTKSVLTLFLTYFFVVFIKMGVYGAIMSYVAAVIITSLAGFALVKSCESFKISFNIPLLKEMFIFGWKPYLGSITISLNYNLDLMFVGILLTTSDVGIYSIAVTFSTLAWMISDAVQYVLFPEVAHSSSINKNRNLVILSTKQTFYLTVVANLILYAVAWFAIPFLYTEAFSPSLIPLAILIIGSNFFCVAKVISSALVGEGQTEIGLQMTVPAVIVNLIFNLILIPKYGINGAAIASTIGYIVSFFIVLLKIRKVYGISPRELFFIQKSDLAVYGNLKNIFR